MEIPTEKKIQCGCGKMLEVVIISVKWRGQNGQEYVISDVPSLQCTYSGCEEVYYPGEVEFNLSVLADEMEKNVLEAKLKYHDKY